MVFGKNRFEETYTAPVSRDAKAAASAIDSLDRIVNLSELKSEDYITISHSGLDALVPFSDSRWDAR